MGKIGVLGETVLERVKKVDWLAERVGF